MNASVSSLESFFWDSRPLIASAALAFSTSPDSLDTALSSKANCAWLLIEATALALSILDFRWISNISSCSVFCSAFCNSLSANAPVSDPEPNTELACFMNILLSTLSPPSRAIASLRLSLDDFKIFLCASVRPARNLSISFFISASDFLSPVFAFKSFWLGI